MTALFSKKEEVKNKSAKKAPTSKTPKKKAEKKTVGVAGKTLSSKVLLAPWVTEKAYANSEQGKYTFYVAPKSSKSQIKRAVEELYEVQVTGVATVCGKPKKKQRGRYVGYTTAKKKAIVTLKKGESISLFDGE